MNPPADGGGWSGAFQRFFGFCRWIARTEELPILEPFAAPVRSGRETAIWLVTPDRLPRHPEQAHHHRMNILSWLVQADSLSSADPRPGPPATPNLGWLFETESLPLEPEEMHFKEAPIDET